MNLQRITRIQVAIAGLALAVAIALVFVFIFIQPRRRMIETAEANAAAALDYARIRPQVEAQLAEANAREREVNRKYEEIMETRMPSLDFSDPIASTIRMWDFAEEERRLIEQWFERSGARVTGYGFPDWGRSMPASFPNPDRVTLDPLRWTLTIEARDYKALKDWLLKLPEAPRFMVMESITIQGPRQAGQPLVATVPVTLWHWTGVLPQATAVAAVPGMAAPGAGAPEAGMAGPGMGGARMGGMRGGMGGGPRGGPGMGGGPRGGGMRGGF